MANPRYLDDSMELSSTTDTQEQINEAAGLPPDFKPEEPVAPSGEEVKPAKPAGVTEPKAPPEPEAGEVADEHGEEVEGKPDGAKRLSGAARNKAKRELLAAEKAELEERLQRIDSLIEEKLAKALAKSPEKEEPKPVEPAPDLEPQQDAFEKYEDFLDARFDWRQRRRDEAAKVELTKKAEEDARNKVVEEEKQVGQAFQERWNQARTRIPRFDEVMEAAGGYATIPPAISYLLIRREDGPEFALHLAEHPEDAKRLMEMCPAGAPQTAALATAFEAGRIYAGLSATAPTAAPPTAPPPDKPTADKPKATPPAIPKAHTPPPPPISPVGGAAAPTATSEDELSDEEYFNRTAHRPV